MAQFEKNGVKSPSPRRAWIEIQDLRVDRLDNTVAIPAEGSKLIPKKSNEKQARRNRNYTEPVL